jgi:hypothetical protein
MALPVQPLTPATHTRIAMPVTPMHCVQKKTVIAAHHD